MFILNFCSISSCDGRIKMMQIYWISIIVRALRSKKQLLFLGLIATIFFSIPSLGFAKPAQKGIKLGSNARLSPRLYLSAGFDSNTFHRSSGSKIQSDPKLADMIGSPYFNIRPGLYLRVPTKVIEFNVGGYANYSIYTEGRAQGLSQLTGKGDLELRFFPEAAVSLLIANYFSRNSGDFYSASDVFDRVLFYYNAGSSLGGVFLSLNNRTQAHLTIQPGGKVLRIDLGYEFKFGLYPSSDLNNSTHRFSFEFKWDFFPRTALLFQAYFDMLSYRSELFSDKKVGVNTDMTPLKLYVGLTGQFTDRLLMTVKLGWGHTFTDKQDSRNVTKEDYLLPIGMLDLTYYISHTVFLRFGLRHDFMSSYFGNYYTESMASLELSAMLGRFLLSLRADGGLLSFAKINTTLGGVQFNSSDKSGNIISRRDPIIRGSATAEFRPVDWLMFGLQGRIVWRDSNTFVNVGSDTFGLGYLKFEALFKTEVAF